MSHHMKKRFGQNFIRDKNLLNKIARESHIDGKTVIEIGPGQGGLTMALVARAKRVIAYEIDSTLSPFLDELEETYDNLEVVYHDFLDINLDLYDEDIHVAASLQPVVRARTPRTPPRPGHTYTGCSTSTGRCSIRSRMSTVSSFGSRKRIRMIRRKNRSDSSASSRKLSGKNGKR